MLFSELLTLFNNGGSIDEKTEYLQQAYEDVIKKLRLDMSIHPLRFTSACRLEGFNYKGKIVESNSELAFKEIVNILKVDHGIDETVEYTYDTPLFGNVNADEYGYTDFDKTNNNQLTVPEIYVRGTDLINITDVDDKDMFVLLEGYVYPYPVLPYTEDVTAPDFFWDWIRPVNNLDPIKRDYNTLNEVT